jgi:hypothetical protein
MAATTFEEAKLCMKCSKPGQDTRTTKTVDQRGKPIEVHAIYCRNAICPWFDSPWFVQVNEDGSIPDPTTPKTSPKEFPGLSQESETRIKDAIDAQLAAEIRGDGEIRGRF